MRVYITDTHTQLTLPADGRDGAKLSDSSVSRYSRTQCGNGQFDHRPPAWSSKQLRSEAREQRK